MERVSTGERESLQGSDQWSGEKVVCSSAHQAVNKQQVIGYQWVFQAKQFTRHKVHLLRIHIESSCNWASQWGEVPSLLAYWTFWISFRAIMHSPAQCNFATNCTFEQLIIIICCVQGGEMCRREAPGHPGSHRWDFRNIIVVIQWLQWYNDCSDTMISMIQWLQWYNDCSDTMIAIIQWLQWYNDSLMHLFFVFFFVITFS